MGAIASLEPSTLQVDPGGQATCTVRVRNTGTIVDEYTFEVLGPAAGWTAVEPDTLRLLPSTEDTVQLVFRPPRSPNVTSGHQPFGVKVDSREDPPGSVVEEGTVTVTPFEAVSAELVPRTSTGRFRGRHELAVDNRGNHPITTDVTAFDDDDQLEFEVKDAELRAEPGTAVFTTLSARPRKRFWRGPNQTRPFRVVLHTEAAPPVTVDGSLLQKAILPKWTLKALLALVAALVLLGILWATVLRPTIESAAQDAVADAVDEPLAQQQAAVDQLRDSVNDINEELGKSPVPTPSADASGGAVRTTEEPRDFRLTASAPAGAADEDRFEVGENQTFDLTDLVLQNPDGNVGRLEIRRNDQTLLVVALENFRDLDYHFVAPVTFAAGDAVVLRLECREITADGSSACAVGTYVGGSMVTTTPA